ncbi:hypothetical protein [Pseudodesulfovibrio sp.]|uniref:hypothetical protein n=1 Tax=unclassified Pseudodesulfovibrio TaxID=2661612 RepID=UPI003AFFBC8A
MMLEYIKLQGDFDKRTSCEAQCRVCGRKHALPLGPSLPEAYRLIKSLLHTGRVDYDAPEDRADPRLSTAPLFGEARGQMFGVLVCRDKQGRTGVLKAFSGQMNGVWQVPGWVPPLVDTRQMAAMSWGPEKLIKKYGSRIASLPVDSPERNKLIERRRGLSRALTKDIHALYLLPNFRRQLKPMVEVVGPDRGIPTGTGDCCAPKLIGYAARYGLVPLGISEFYLGRENRSKTRINGAVYPACSSKCGLILGHMLCGLEDL